MYENQVVLCGSNAYEQKYYLNEDFSALPQGIKEELQIMCVLFTEDVGGVLTLCFEEDGTLMMQVQAEEDDFLYDEINDIVYFNEVNTIPGFTNISMYPKLMEHSNINYSDLLDKLTKNSIIFIILI